MFLYADPHCTGRAVEAIQFLAIQQATGYSDGAVAIDCSCDDGVLMTSASEEREWQAKSEQLNLRTTVGLGWTVGSTCIV